MKVVQALPEMPQPVTESEAASFLDSKLNMQLATIDDEGFPIIQPVWFIYDKESEKIYTGTRNVTRKIQNIQRRPGKVYFSIDDENFPYKGAKGRAVARIIKDVGTVVGIIEKINIKYLGTNEHPLAQMLLDNARKGEEVVIEITPKFFSVWDFGKSA